MLVSISACGGLSIVATSTRPRCSVLTSPMVASLVRGREARLVALAQRADALAHVLAEEAQHLVGGARVEGRLGGADPVVQRALRPAQRVLRSLAQARRDRQ